MNFGIICDLFIASSSDCEKAKPLIAQACYEWNQVHGQKEGVFIQPRFCEIDGYPALCRPQDQLNEVLNQCDIAVALVWYKFADGLREELERSIQQQKKLLVYFSEKGIPPKKINEANMDAIENFKSSYQENVYWWSCEGDEQLAELFRRHLQQTMNNFLNTEIKDFKNNQILTDNTTQNRTNFDAFDTTREPDRNAKKILLDTHQRGDVLIVFTAFQEMYFLAGEKKELIFQCSVTTASSLLDRILEEGFIRDKSFLTPFGDFEDVLARILPTELRKKLFTQGFPYKFICGSYTLTKQGLEYCQHCKRQVFKN